MHCDSGAVAITCGVYAEIQRLKMVTPHQSGVDVVQEYSGHYFEMGKNATTDKRKELAHPPLVGAPLECHGLWDAGYCFTMTPQAILGPPGASFVGGSGRYLSGSSWITKALPS